MKKGNKFLIVMMMLVSMLITVQTATAAAAFTDTKTHWAKAEIDTAVGQGWINGYDAKTFKPNENMTRAEFLKSLVAAMKYRVEDMDTPFTDDEGWYRAYIATGLKQSLIKVAEYEDAAFEPKKKITREEIARMVVRALGKDDDGIKLGYLVVAKQLNIMKGYPDGTMGGDKNATRAEAVVMILNAFPGEKVVEKPVAYPKTKEELNVLIQSLPSFKGTTMFGRNIVLYNSKGTDKFEDASLRIEYEAELKVTIINVFEPTSENKAIVKDLLKHYYPQSFEKAYASYIKIDGMKFVEGENSINTTYDKLTFKAYKSNDNKTVVIWVGE